MKYENMAALLASGQAKPVAVAPLTLEQRFDAIIEAFSQREGQRFSLFHGLERMPEDALRKFKGTVFGLMAEAIGLEAENLGEVMDAIPLSRAEVHLFGCDCLHAEDPTVEGGIVAMVMTARKMHHCGT